PEAVAARRPAPVAYRVVNRDLYRLTLPEGFVSSGARQIHDESRTVEVWSGLIGGDAHTTVAVNLTPLADRHLGYILERAARGLRAAPADPPGVHVPGAARSQRPPGLTLANT